MALTYICENHWIFEHSTKYYSRDLFLFVLIIFFAYGIYTIKPVHDLSLLGREQTEEWKGWMQFIFLLYHYFHAEEVYNSVRVMITCYVWMTGFGNFSFFYIKQDYGWLRVMQMMWRLNFSVLLLMWTHGNTYILYYICPMHTFYFLMVYLTMYCFSSVNTTKWGIRWKLLVVGIIIYIIWDINGGIFDILFAFLGTDKVIGANNGSVWEYYFRTSLDHWSSFLGMIFALNFPLAEQYFVKAKGWPLVFASVLMGALALWWLLYCYTQEKLEYNLTHSYFAIIPLTAYIFFRNITPRVRSGVSMSLHDLGKTTLETYLLQHHIWLTSNAKTLLTIVPEHPWINFALCTMLFFFVSKELYRLTMTLRGMIIPDDKTTAWNNILGSIIVLAVFYVLALIFAAYSPSLLQLTVGALVIGIMAVLGVGRLTRNFNDNQNYQHTSNRVLILFGVIILFLGAQLSMGPTTGSTEGAAPAQFMGIPRPAYEGPNRECLNAISSGHWISLKCHEPQAGKPSISAYCGSDQWVWDVDADCPVSKFDTAKLQSIYKNKRVAFIGDSSVRNAYHQFITLLEPTYHQNHSTSYKHSDIKHTPIFDKNASVSFVWAPMLPNITSTLKSFQQRKESYDLVVCGATYWDALYTHDVKGFTDGLSALAKDLKAAGGKQVNVWLLPTTVLDDRLLTPEKQQFMNEKTVQQYREAVKKSDAVASAFVVIDPSKVSAGRESGSADGIHYGEEVYHVLANMISNAYSLHFPAHYKPKPAAAKPYTPKVTGSMSSPKYGAMILVLSCIMLFLMDSWMGIGYLSLLLFGRFYDWDAAYESLHRTIYNGLNKNKEKAPAVAHTAPRNKGDDPEESQALLA